MTGTIEGEYSVPKAIAEVEYEIKKSRFIARAYPARSRAQALEQIQFCRDDYADARHHCWAMVIGSPRSPTNVAQSDDGEPSGTAGKPILNVLQHKGIGDILLVVIRYFGGIKLGAGGLVRAYSHSAQLAMSSLQTVVRVPCMQCCFSGDFATEQPLRQWLNAHQGRVLDIHYSDKIGCCITLPVAHKASLDEFSRSLGAKVKAVKESSPFEN